MSFDNFSIKKMALIFIIAGVVLVIAIMGSSATSLFRASITEDAQVKIKQSDECIVEASDKIPRIISDCQYNINDTISVTYKIQHPSIEKHSLVSN